MKALIVGGGISGLSLAWRLFKRGIPFTLLEEKSSLGGWIRSDQKQGFFFERGAKTFSPLKALHLLELIYELDLTDQLILSSKQAKTRYLLKDEKLVPYPSSLFSFLTSALSRGCTTTLLKECFSSPKIKEDESIANFARRKFNVKIAEHFFDPLTVGIYGGDYEKLSYQSCFPKLYELEKTKGSILKGLMQTKGCSLPLFTLKNGMGSLIQALQRKLQKQIVCNEKVVSIESTQQSVQVHTSNRSYSCMHLFFAAPFFSMKKLLKCGANLKSASLNVVHIGFSKQVLKYPGFGYLVPSKTRIPLLGMVFDSNLFQEQNQQSQTRLTALLDNRLSKGEMHGYIKNILIKHLQITESIDYLDIHFAKQAIAQFEVGHAARVATMRQKLKEKHPRVTLLGNYLDGVSVDHCISQSKNIIYHLDKSFKLTF